MAYLNPTYVTDIHVKKIAGADLVNIASEVAQLDLEIKNICYSFNINIDDLPVDESGYITSMTLIQYAIYWLYNKVLSDHWGAAHGENDIYYEKLIKYEKEQNSARTDLTRENILMNDPDSSDFVSEVVIY